MSSLSLKSDTQSRDDMRCCNCQKLLAKYIGEHVKQYEIKCTRCHTMNGVGHTQEMPLYILDPCGSIIFVNEAFESATGYLLKEVMGRRPCDWIVDKDAIGYDRCWQQLLAEKRSMTVCVANRKKDGTLYVANLVGCPVQSSDQEVLFVVCTLYIKG